MSIKLMTQVWAMGNVSKEKMVLLSLADQANDDGVCWPDTATIARRCSVSEKTVKRSIAGLVDLGLLTVKSEYGKPSVYHLHLDGKKDNLSADLDNLSNLKKDNLSTNLDNLSANLDNLSDLHTRTQKNPKETPTRVREATFEKVWTAYPLKTAKKPALAEWHKVVGEHADGGQAVADRMLRWIEAQQKTDQWLRGVIPHLRTVLHQARFDDPLPGDAMAAPQGHRCVVCGGNATILFENKRYCREHNAARL